MDSRVRGNDKLTQYLVVHRLAFAASSFYLLSMFSPFRPVEKELRGQVSGDNWFDVEKRAEYSTATCMYKVMPVGVVAPKSLEDVQRVVRLCAESDIAVIPRGGASGLVGQAVGFGVILDFTKYMNRVAGVSEGTSAVTVEDGVVPLRNLPAYIAGLKKILDKYSVAFTVYGHAGMGHIHCSTFEEIATEAGRERIERATQEVFDLIIKLDGVFSAEHGDGFVRTPFLEQAFGSEVYGIFKEMKQTLDLQNIFNPQKIVGRQDRVFLHDLKYA